MLDVSDFVPDKGGDPQKVRESQRRRFASEEIVDQVLASFEDHRKSINFKTELQVHLHLMQNSDV